VVCVGGFSLGMDYQATNSITSGRGGRPRTRPRPPRREITNNRGRLQRSRSRGPRREATETLNKVIIVRVIAIIIARAAGTIIGYIPVDQSLGQRRCWTVTR
jgi:hypothetical protein